MTSEYEKYSDKYADILANQKTPKVGNLSTDELSTFQAQQLAMYKEFLKADSNTAMPTFVAKEEFIEAFAQREGVSTADMTKIFNYVQSTGAVYKGNKMAIYYKYNEKLNTGSYHKVERTR